MFPYKVDHFSAELLNSVQIYKWSQQVVNYIGKLSLVIFL